MHVSDIKDGQAKAQVLYQLVKESNDLNAQFYYAQGMIKGIFSC